MTSILLPQFTAMLPNYRGHSPAKAIGVCDGNPLRPI